VSATSAVSAPPDDTAQRLLANAVRHHRAGELEGIVHKEISAIERAFGGNEDRIRTLLSGLENQRAALQQAGESSDTEASRKWVGELSSYLQSVEAISG